MMDSRDEYDGVDLMRKDSAPDDEDTGFCKGHEGERRC